MKTEHAFWQTTAGPENLIGASLHVIVDWAQHNQECLADAKAKNETRRIRTLERRITEETQEYFHPSLGWWMSKDDFYANKGGFAGTTKDGVFSKHPGLIIHDSKQDAAVAAGYGTERRLPEKTRAGRVEGPHIGGRE